MYSAQLLEHFEHPKNAGTVADDDVSVRMENPACGDVLELTVKLVGGQIEKMRFRARGCARALRWG